MLLRPLIANAQGRAGATAVVDDRGSMTWAELYKRSKRLAKLLRSRTKRSSVAILLPTSGGFAVSFYACLLAGKTPVPINFLLGERETEHVLKDAGCDLVLSVGLLLDKLDAGKTVKAAAERGEVEIIDLMKLKPTLGSILAQLRPLPGGEAGPNDLAVLLYTSGTSGLPKGVELTHGNLDSDAKGCIEHARLDRDGDKHVFLGIVPLFHSTGLLATLLAPVQLGAQMVFCARFNPAEAVKKIREHGVTVMAAVPSMYNAIARVKDAGPADFAKMYVPLSGGEPLPGRVREAFRRKFDADLMEGYGLTETCGPICVNMPHAHKPGSVGKLIPGGEARVVDSDGNDVPRGTTGELLLKGPMVFRGYFKLPEASSEARTSDGFFKSGDLGHIDEDGYLFVTGRAKDMLIVGGENVYPREIEELLGTHPAVAEAAIVGRPDKSRGEAVVAFVIAAEGHELTDQAVKDFLRDKGLASFKMPKEVKLVNDLPRSPTGKVLKRELREQVAGTPTE